MKQTVLHLKHEQSKARMTEFQGWQVPLQFSDALEEHHAVRAAAGLFDIGYLGRIEVSGPGAAGLLQKTVTRNLSKVPEGSAQFGCICNPAGGILDDVFVFRLPAGKTTEARWLLTTNALNAEKVLAWLRQHAPQDVQVVDRTGDTAQLALQGPRSLSILERLAGQHFKKLKTRMVREMVFADTAVLVSRIGYTGEHGYELITPADRAGALWDALIAAGSSEGMLLCGLAARDILRLEMGYLMYGNDIDETRTPIEAGLSFFVDFKKEFIGREALLKIKTEGPKQKLAGFVLLDKGVPKGGGSIFSENREIGVVTSGGHSPQLRKGIGLGYVVSRYSQPGQEIEIEIRDREIAAKIVDLPFYRKK
ncbi:MAG TPA: glycine cleavage system aminomethyltransferase GcvT [Nitrospirota bacterium]|nr:glycine cleavage system aminomethyltransferase GcvT [Nitrospirota bacterium]